jgi:hypothetical protein
VFVDPQTREGVAEEVASALRSLGFDVRFKATGAAFEFVIDGTEIGVVVEPRAVMRPSEVRSLPRPPGGASGVVVSDRVSEAARAGLRREGWGWLDRRGHLRFWSDANRIKVETELPDVAARRPARPTANAFTASGVAIAVELLLEPDQPLPVRATSTRLGISAGHVSLVVAALREQGLVDRTRRPLVPELFWALAEHWPGAGTALLRLPSPDLDDRELALPRWVLSGDGAAAQWGAPVVLSADYPPDLYVPSTSVLRLAIHRFGEAAVAEQRAATLRVMPTRRVVDTAVRRSGIWPVAHPVIVALDLAQDPSRGHEILDAWIPPDGYRRVW